MTALGLELRRTRSLAVALAISLAIYSAIMGLMYPILRSSDALVVEYMKALPKEFLAAFGMTGMLSDPGVFFTTYMASWLWPIIAISAALIAGTRAVAVDLDRGFLDLAISTRLSRTRYLGASILAQVLLMALLAGCGTLVLWAVGNLAGGGFDLGGFLMAGVIAFAFACALAGPTTLCSVLTLSRGTSSAIVGGAVVAMYVIFVVTQISPSWGWIGPLSAWSHFPTTKVIDTGYVPVGDLALFGTIAIGCWAAALWAFRRRDLAA
jgi:hypothetical protein